jgi:hypothetical protein
VSRVRRLAALIATDRAVQAAITGALEASVSDALHRALAAMADDVADGGAVRLYGRRFPETKRQARDARIRELLAQGVKAAAIAAEVKCSAAHVYTIRRQAKA